MPVLKGIPINGRMTLNGTMEISEQLRNTGKCYMLNINDH